MTEEQLKEIESAFVLAFDEDVLIRELVSEVRRLRSPRTCPSCFETMLTPEHCKKMDEWIATAKENTALKAEVEEYCKDISSLRVQREDLEQEKQALTAHFDSCSADKIVELRLELASRFNEIKALNYRLDQGKNDVAQLAAMCNEIVKLRELLREALVVLQCLESEQGREWDLRKRIDAALSGKPSVGEK